MLKKQAMVTWWFGLVVPESEGSTEGDTMGYPKKSKSTKRNHQLTIGWILLITIAIAIPIIGYKYFVSYIPVYLG